jgi:tetratricopeptide (TPR) repeat protein
MFVPSILSISTFRYAGQVIDDIAQQSEVRALLEEATHLMRNDQTALGLERLRLATERAHDQPTLLAEVASVLWHAGRISDAAEELERTLKLLKDTPNYVTSDEQAVLMTRLGAALIRLGRLKDALAPLYEALELSDNGYSALQLGNALRYLGEYQEAAGHFQRAFNKAKGARDGTLAHGALCAQGELALAQGQAQTAVERFGQALGLSEAANDEALSIPPLAGLGQAHTLWGYPSKGAEVAGKALTRARALKDKVGVARSLLSLGLALNDLQHLQNAEKEALSAPHQPLALRALVAQLDLVADPDELVQAITLATKLGMRPQLEHLRKLEQAGAATSIP